MALTSTEIDECRWETGYAVTRIGAEPYITYAAAFDVAIQPFVTDVGDSSTTLVAAATGGARVAVVVSANPALPQKPNGLAFIAGNLVNVDLGPNQETDVVIEAVVGLTLYLTLANAHGTGGISYPVVLAGAEKVVRDVLTRLRNVRSEFDIARRTAGIASADQGEAEFFASKNRGKDQRSKFDELVAIRDYYRDELCQVLNLENLWRLRKREHAGGGIEPY